MASCCVPCGTDVGFPSPLDVLLTRDLARFHIINFSPYVPRTDPLLSTYDELATLFAAGTTSTSALAPAPALRVIDSRAHPAATWNSPETKERVFTYQIHNGMARSGEPTNSTRLHSIKRRTSENSHRAGAWEERESCEGGARETWYGRTLNTLVVRTERRFWSRCALSPSLEEMRSNAGGGRKHSSP